MDVVLDQSSENLLCCRVCLMTDCKLFNIHEYKLADAFSRISGTPVFKGRLPQYLCTYCHTLLLKCANFRMMCLRTERCLKQELLKGELNTDRILRIDRMAHRLFHLTLTEVETVDLPAKRVISQPSDVVDIDETKIEAVAKEEANSSIDGDTDNEANTVDINEASADADDFEAYSVMVKRKETNIISIDDDTNDNQANSDIDNVNEDEENIIYLDETSGDTDYNKATLPTAATNINKVGVVKRNTDKVNMDVTRLNTANINKVGIVKRNIDNVNMDLTRLNTANISTVTSNINKVGVVKRNIDKVNMRETPIAATVRKPNLQMELEILKGELKIKVVKDVKDIPAVKNIGTEINANSDEEIDVSNVNNCSLEQILLRSIEKAKRRPKNVTEFYNKVNLNEVIKKKGQARTKVQMHIFKNSKDMLNNLGNLNADVIKTIKNERSEFDNAKFEKDFGVKIVTLSKEEQLEEIAARKQTRNYLDALFKCEDCGKAFGRQATYSKHRMRHSPSAGDAVCEICSLRFRRNNRHRGHLLRHRLKIVCDTCGFVSRSRINARAHHAMHQGKIFCCPYCGKVFSKNSTYLSHVRIAHPAEHSSCPLCGETFIGARGLHTHNELVHKYAEKPQAQHKCSICSASFVSLDALNTHADMGDHEGSPCEQCGESCASEEELQAHVEARHPPESHECEECCMTFSSTAAYDVHYRRKHLNERPSQPPGAPRRNQRRVRAQHVMCEQCGKVLKLQSAAQLRAHQEAHRGVKRFACPLCPKTYAANYLRKEHMRKHTGEKPFQCELCPQAFTNKGNMQRHHKYVHLGEHDHATCAECGRVCTTRSSLRVHVRAVHRRQGWPKRNRPRRAAIPDGGGGSNSGSPPTAVRRLKRERQNK